jgi:hypothetical protein
MGLLVECPACKKRHNPKVEICPGSVDKKTGLVRECGFALKKHSGRVYWIEWYQEGKLKRLRIGPNKAAAEEKYRQVLSARAHGRVITKSPDSHTLFSTLAAWYLDLPEVQAKKSYDCDQKRLKNLLPYFGDKLLKISPRQ